MTKPDPLVQLSDPTWILSTEGHDHLREGSIESRFTVSNGFLGVRGGRSVTRGARWVVPPRTYIAGLFDTPSDENAIAVLVPAASWLQVRVSVPGRPLVHHPFDVASHRMMLDMRRGMVLTDWSHAHAGVLSVHIRTARFVSMAKRALGVQVIRMEVEGGETEIAVEAAFEGLDLGLIPEHIDDGFIGWRTQASKKRLAMATSANVTVDGQHLEPETSDSLRYFWRWKTRPGQIVRLERLVAFVRSDDLAFDPGPAAREIVTSARLQGWRPVVTAHEEAWQKRWNASDIVIEGDEASQLALRFAIYHLNSAANPEDETVSIGARALTGDDYHGHVFWDTDIYLLPFYTWTWPEAARAALMYRFNTLDGARKKAADMGYRGALYAWESTDTGIETTPTFVIGPDRQIVPVLSGLQEHHISADVAYAVWNYWKITADREFICTEGAEIMFETARFWASRAKLEADGKSHIRLVIGPDEYHEGVDDNAFTNVMARWTIRRSLELASKLKAFWPDAWESLARKLVLTQGELDDWEHAADTIVDGLDPKTGLYEQFEGFFGLEYIDLKAYCGRTVPMDVVVGRERTQQSQIVKQADVVALLGLLPEEFPGEMAKANFEYYEPRCGHGSSLSASMHGVVAARFGKVEMALRYLRQSAKIDLHDGAVSIGGGIHIAALGGNWMIPVLGFAGLAYRDDGISLDPKLPSEWRTLSFAAQWRGRHFKVRIAQDENMVGVELIRGDPMMVTLRDQSYDLKEGKPVRMPLGDVPTV